jgi:hypothetical protein
VEGIVGLATYAIVVELPDDDESRMVVHVGHESSNQPSTVSLPPATTIPFFPAMHVVVQMPVVVGAKAKVGLVPVILIVKPRFAGEMMVCPVVTASSPCTSSRGRDSVTFLMVPGTFNFPIILRPLSSVTVEPSATFRVTH